MPSGRNPLSFLYDSETKSTDVVGSDSLRFTTAAGFAGALTAITGAVLPLVDKFTALNVSENIKIAMIGLVGVGILGWAIASAGDVLARAYATAHVIPAADANTPPTAAAAWVVKELLDTLKAAGPELKSQATALTTALSQAPVGTIIPIGGGGINAKYKSHDCKVFALRRDANDRTKLQYLYARDQETPEWAPEGDIEVA